MCCLIECNAKLLGCGFVKCSGYPHPILDSMDRLYVPNVRIAYAGDFLRAAPAPTTAAMAIMVVARLHGSLAALTAQSTVWARMQLPGKALVRRLVLFADSTLDTVHTICSGPQSRCVFAPPVPSMICQQTNCENLIL
jgi:hypothetical protein